MKLHVTHTWADVYVCVYVYVTESWTNKFILTAHRWRNHDQIVDATRNYVICQLDQRSCRPIIRKRNEWQSINWLDPLDTTVAQRNINWELNEMEIAHSLLTRFERIPIFSFSKSHQLLSDATSDGCDSCETNKSRTKEREWVCGTIEWMCGLSTNNNNRCLLHFK